MVKNVNSSCREIIVTAEVKKNKKERDGLEIMDTKDYLEQKMAILDEQIKIYSDELDSYSDLHEGVLVQTFRRSGQLYYYLQYNDDNGKKHRKYVGKEDNELVKKYKIRRFLEEEVKRLENNRKGFLEISDELVDCSPEAIRNSLPKAYKDLPSECFVDHNQEAFTEEDDEYPSNPLKIEGIPNIASDGTPTRSKGELIIYDDLQRSNLHGKFDVKIRRKGESGIYHNLYPDFLFMGQDGREIVWEHLGMTDTDKYADRLRDKISEYLDCGFVVGDNLFFTSDTLSHSINEVMVLDMIDNMKHKVYGNDRNVSVGCIYTADNKVELYS